MQIQSKNNNQTNKETFLTPTSLQEMEEMLEKDLQDSKKTISSLQIRIEQLTKQLQVSQSNSHQILELQNQVQSLTAKNDNLEKKSVRLETENDALETKV